MKLFKRGNYLQNYRTYMYRIENYRISKRKYAFDNPNNHCAQCASSWVKQKHHDLAFGNQKRFVALLVQSTGNFLQNSDLKPTIQLQLNSVRAPKGQLISKANSKLFI